MDEKMTRDILVDPPLPVSSGDTVANPLPLECHVLFEWTLTTQNFSNILRAIILLPKIQSPTVSREKQRKTLLYKKADHKMLEKLITDVNFATKKREKVVFIF